MSGLITVEDYNSALLNYDNIFELVVDGSKFPTDSDHFMYDFLEITYSEENNQLTLINKSNWNYRGVQTNHSKGYAPAVPRMIYLYGITDVHSVYAKIYFYSEAQNNPIGLFTDCEGVVVNGFINQPKQWIIKSEVGSTATSLVFSFDRVPGIITPTAREKKGDYWYYYYNIPNYSLTNPIVNFRVNNVIKFEFINKEFKNPNFVNITGNLYSAKKDNELTIEPFMTGTEEKPITCKISYLDKTETITLESSNTIKLDLRDYTSTQPLKLTIELSEGPYTNRETLTYEVPVNIQTVNSWSSLYNELTNNEGTQIIRLGANLTAPYNTRIPILHDTIIIGNNKTLNLNHSSLVLQEGKTLKIQNLTLSDGDNAIIQKDNTTLELDGCTFQYCTSRQAEGLGSCVYCDIDLDSLTIPNDFTTNINNCTFRESYGAILHGGQLNITNSSYGLTSSNRINTHSPYFLYQTDGEATLTGNSFDVDILENVYDCEPLLSSGTVTRYSTNAELITAIQSCRAYLAESDTEATIQDLFDTQGLIEDIHFCEATKNANQGQCLFALGENALINGQTHNSLTNPNNCNLLLNNASHIFMKYYYPEIEACVYISPLTGYETKALCYALSGLDWIYKVNAQITRASWNTENVNNPLREA